MKNFPLGKLLLVAAALFQATQYTRLGRLLDGQSSPWFWLIAGGTVNLSLAYSANRLPRIRSRKAQGAATAAFWCILIITPALLAPVNAATMQPALFFGSQVLRWVLATLAASVVDIAIIFVAFADGSLLPQVDAQPTQVDSKSKATSPSPNRVKPERKRARNHITDAQLIDYLTSNPGASNAVIARNFGVSRQAISERRKHIKPL